jgi:hypothetical protein
MSFMSAEKTFLGSEPSAVKTKCRANLEINPSRLQFESAAPTFSNAISMDSGFDSMEAESFEGGSEVERSSLRDVRGIRHLDEDRFDEMERYTSIPDSRMWGNTVIDSKCSPPFPNESSNEPCFTPTGCCFTPTGCCVAPWDQSSSSAIMSASPTPLLSRPLKKMHIHHDSELDTHVERNESAIMDREDFTRLFREASSLDFQSHYEYGTLLGRGHFGEVWSVRHTRSVHINIMLYEVDVWHRSSIDVEVNILVRRSGKLYALKKSIHRFRGRRDQTLFLREINCVADLKPHKNIVRYDR